MANGHQFAHQSLLPNALGVAADPGPFPWQQRLYERFLRSELPRSIDVPTGLGKTSVMALWLLARADNPGLPRRLVYVVDRRAVVDQATSEAERLRDWVSSTPEIARALGLASETRLAVSTLRGQFVDNREWLEDPARPAIVVGTVDMIGSRLLFQGYGVSRRMRPYHAGLLAYDSLFVVDEAHLVPAFERLLDEVTRELTGTLGPVRSLGEQLPPTSRLVTLSATGRTHQGESFVLDANDSEHPIARRRIQAPKRVLLHDLPADAKLSDAVVAKARELLDREGPPRRLVLYLDRRRDAIAVAGELRKLAVAGQTGKNKQPTFDVELLVGARRVWERQRAQEWLAEHGFLPSGEASLERSAVLVATSAGEVGVDLDAEHAVCDLVAWERMVQRFGRVNRRGLGAAEIHVLAQPPAAKKGKAKASADEEEIPAETGEGSPEDGAKGGASGPEEDSDLRRFRVRREALSSLPRLPEGGFDGSVAALRSLANRAEREPELAELLLRATTPAPLYPPLERATVDDWAMTQLPLHAGRPEVAPWLRGWVESEPRTRLVWRRQLPATPERAPSENELRRYVEVAPPLLAEVLEAETAIVFDWLKKRLKELDKERSKASLDEGRKEQLALLQRLAFFVLDPDGELERVFPLDDALRWVGSKNAARQLAGRTLILSSLIGGLESGGLDAKAKGTAPAADEEQPFGSEPELDPPPVTFRVRQATEQAHELEDPRWRLRERLPLRVDAEGEVLCWLAVYKWTNAAETEEDRSVGRPQSLAEHQEWVRERAEGEAQSLGLSESLERVLAAAALSHDEGKRARRWQEAFRAPSEGGPYAKTLGPLNVALLGGYRHEFGSLPYAAERADPDRWTDDERDLLLHLVAAHHGYARPFLRPDGCEQAPPSRLESRSREVTLRYFRLQRRWGPWGLAYLEALLRAADQRASRDNDALALAGAKEGLRAD